MTQTHAPGFESPPRPSSTAPDSLQPVPIDDAPVDRRGYLTVLSAVCLFALPGVLLAGRLSGSVPLRYALYAALHVLPVLGAALAWKNRARPGPGLLLVTQAGLIVLFGVLLTRTGPTHEVSVSVSHGPPQHVRSYTESVYDRSPYGRTLQVFGDPNAPLAGFDVP